MSSEASYQDRQQRAEESDAMVSGLRQGREDTLEEKTELIEQLTDDDLGAADATLQNLTTKDIPSANFSEAEAHEFRHYLEVVLERKKAAHPHEGQDVTGELREWVHDDQEAGLEPVSKNDLITDNTFVQAVAARITKGKEGKLLDSALRSIRESVLRRDSEDSSGGGILGKVRR